MNVVYSEGNLTHVKTSGPAKTTPALSPDKRRISPVPLECLALGHVVTAPIPWDVIVHTTVSAEQRSACAQEHGETDVAGLHCGRNGWHRRNELKMR